MKNEKYYHFYLPIKGIFKLSIHTKKKEKGYNILYARELKNASKCVKI